MNVLKTIFGLGGGIEKTIDAVGNAVDKIHTSASEKADAKLLIEKLRQQPSLLQIELNKAEAQHRSVLVAGWRPGLAWCCVFAIAYHYIVRDLMIWTFSLIALWFGLPIIPPPPVLDIGLMIQLMIGILGLAGFRSFEKYKGVSG
jgi:hypothetical protein